MRGHPGPWDPRVSGAAPGEDALVAGIEREVIFPGRRGGVTWFHPRPCMVPTPDGPLAVMTLQSISGSDVFGPVHWTTSTDLGRTWTAPEPIPGLGRRDLGDGWEVGVCDVVPEYHPPTTTVLAIGHNVYYENGVLARPQRRRWPVYVVRSPDGRWSGSRAARMGRSQGLGHLHLRLLAAGRPRRRGRADPAVVRPRRPHPPLRHDGPLLVRWP